MYSYRYRHEISRRIQNGTGRKETGDDEAHLQLLAVAVQVAEQRVHLTLVAATRRSAGGRGIQ